MNKRIIIFSIFLCTAPIFAGSGDINDIQTVAQENNPPEISLWQETIDTFFRFTPFRVLLEEDSYLIFLGAFAGMMVIYAKLTETPVS
jgi:hypothetical protein